MFSEFSSGTKVPLPENWLLIEMAAHGVSGWMSKDVSSSGNTEMASVQERVRRRLPGVLGR